MELPFDSGSWERKRNAGSRGRITIDTKHEKFKGTQRTPVWPWQSWIVVEWRNPKYNTWHVVYAGVITEASYEWASKKLTLSHEDIWTIFSKRIVTTDRSNDISSSKVTWTNLSKATMIKKIIQNITNNFGSPLIYDLPISLPADAAGSEDMTVYGYNFDKASDLINDYIEDDEGPDIDFRPRWSSEGTLEWVMEVNANKTRVWDYDLDVDKSSVENMNYTLSGAYLVNKMYGTGEGTERRTLTRQSSSDGFPYPALEDAEKFSGMKSLERLQSATTGARRAKDGAIRQLDMAVRADGSPALNELALGGSVRWKADKDSWLLSGWHPFELIGLSGDLTSEVVKIETQEMEGRSSGA
ncbi:hypothetical protein [Glutamicibacter sp.]|uniref:hypothetical protein n=1 Tax=Glutamicibacter sp. TaxID=1931995 RepID=UPI0028BD8997|nr:hypothetical protein [Glutamicibacter sp.]